MLLKILQFELSYTFRSPVFWIISAAYFVFALLYASSSVSVLGLTTAAINVNSPWAITRMTVQLSYISLLTTAAFAGSSIIRDYRSGISNILFTTRMRKPDYVFGRFLGGFLACLLAFSFVFLGIAAGSLAPWADPRQLGPFPSMSLLTAVVVFAIPNIFIGCALLFSLSLLTRDTLKTYVGAIALIIGFFISRAFAGAFYATTDSQVIASLVEPFGNYAATMAVLDWTPFERNTQLIIDQALIVQNRLIWVGLSAGILFLSYFNFRMQAPGTSGRKKAKTAPTVMSRSVNAPIKQTAGILPRGSIAPSSWLQFKSLVSFELRQLMKNPGFLTIVALTAIGYWFWASMYGRAYGTGFYPHTGLMASHIQSVVQVPLLAALVFLAAEFVWRSRTRKFDEILDSMPVGPGSLYFSKLVGLIAAAFIVLTALVITAISYQLSRGYTGIEFSTYAIQAYAISLPYFAVFAALALFLQVVIGQRFLAMLAMVVLFVFTLIAGPAGITSNLIIPGGVVNVYHDDFAGFGHYFVAAEWIRFYWLAIAGLLSIFGISMLNRGKENGFMRRAARVRSDLSGPLAPAFVVFLVVSIGLGGYTATNTLFLYPTPSAKKLDAAAVAYEEQYAGLTAEVQPKLEKLVGTLELFPADRHFEFQGVYTLVNREADVIQKFSMTAPKQLILTNLETSVPAEITADDELGVYQFRLSEPLGPDQSMTVSFHTKSEAIRGFRNNPARTPVRHDGSLLFYNDFLPLLGYVHGREISHDNDREDYGLGERMPTLREFGDDRGFSEQEGQVFTDWMSSDLMIVTPADQISIGQGDLVEDSVQEGRRTMRYQSSRRVKLHMGIAAGRYEQQARDIRFGDRTVALEVYHSPKHDENIDALLDTMELTLGHLKEEYGPYPYNQLRLVEASVGRPNCRIRSDTLLCDSSMGFINDPELDDPRSPPSILTKLPSGMISNLYVQAQIMPANYPGATSIADGLGFYLSASVWQDSVSEHSVAETVRDVTWKYFMERAKGEHLEGTVVDHVNQTFIGAHKNTALMYGLDYYLGRDKMRAAITSFLEKYGFQDEPFPRMKDLVAEFRAVAPDEVQPIITDFFEQRTLFNISARDAEMVENDDGTFTVTFKPSVAKFYATPEGESEETPFDYTVEAVVFGAMLDETGTREVLHRTTFTPEALRSHTLSLTVSERPYSIGLDPFYRLLDRNYLDNTTPINWAR